MNNIHQTATDSAEQFDKEHGGENAENVLYENGWIYFPDGCYREANPMGARVTPTDPYRRAQLVLRFWKCKVKLATDEFALFKNNLLNSTRASANQTFAAPPPDANAIERLNFIKAKVYRYQNEVKKAEKAWQKMKPHELIQREQCDAETRLRCENVFAQIKGIEI